MFKKTVITIALMTFNFGMAAQANPGIEADETNYCELHLDNMVCLQNGNVADADHLNQNIFAILQALSEVQTNINSQTTQITHEAGGVCVSDGTQVNCSLTQDFTADDITAGDIRLDELKLTNNDGDVRFVMELGGNDNNDIQFNGQTGTRILFEDNVYFDESIIVEDINVKGNKVTFTNSSDQELFRILANGTEQTTLSFGDENGTLVISGNLRVSGQVTADEGFNADQMTQMKALLVEQQKLISALQRRVEALEQ